MRQELCSTYKQVALDPEPRTVSRLGDIGSVSRLGRWHRVVNILDQKVSGSKFCEHCEPLETIAPPRKTTADSIRDVWRITRPLTTAWNYVNPLRNNPALRHWCVLVAEVDNEVLEAAVRHRKELKKKKKGWGLGIIHELNRVGKQSAYRVYKWMSNAIKGGYHFMRVGKTKLKNDEILSNGMACSRTLRY